MVLLVFSAIIFTKGFERIFKAKKTEKIDSVLYLYIKIYCIEAAIFL